MGGGHDQVARREWQLVLAVDELRATCQRVPQQPGVYLFRDRDRQPLYVGTSRNLRRRLESYFQPAARRRRKEWTLLRQAMDVELRLAGSAFAALLDEVRLIQALAPPINRRLKAPERYVYLQIADPQRFPYLTIQHEPSAGRSLGPFAPRSGLSRALEVLQDAFGLRSCDRVLAPGPNAERCWRADVGTCSAPCVGRVQAGAYGRRFARALAAVAGGGRRGLADLLAQREMHVAAERFEAAARVQRQVESILRLRRVLRPVELAREWDRVIVVQPHPGAAVALWPVVGGSVAARRVATSADLAVAFDAIWAAANALAPPATAKADVDAARIIHRWLRAPANRCWVIDVRRNGRGAAWRQVQRLAARCLPPQLWANE